MFKTVVKYKGVLPLLVINAFIIYYYIQHPEQFNTIVWIYWLQSVLIGFFNCAELWLVKNPDENSLKLNDEPVKKGGMGCAALFFLFHYSFFHFIYAIFLLTNYSKGVNTHTILLSGGLFFGESTVRFIQNRIVITDQKTNVGKMFFMPYLRILPMHLMILIPGLLGFGSSVVFLVLRALADAGMYVITQYSIRKQQL